jgi:hypothetical protein
MSPDPTPLTLPLTNQSTAAESMIAMSEPHTQDQRIQLVLSRLEAVIDAENKALGEPTATTTSGAPMPSRAAASTI